MPTTKTHSARLDALQRSSADPASSRRLAWIRLLLVAATFVVFARLCVADFSNIDDPQTTYDNPHLTPPTLQNIAWFWTHPYMDIYAPIPFTLWGALLNVSKVPTPNEIGVTYNSFIFHTVNVLLHIGSVLVLFELLRRLTRHAGASAIGTLLFALHPVQVEAVGWISGGKDLLYGFFALIALWQYVLYVQGTEGERHEGTEARRREGKGEGRPSLHYAVALIALLSALLSKPTAVVAPALALVIDYWLLRRDIKKAMWSLWPWFFLAVPFAIIAKFAQPAAEVFIWPLWSRPLIALDALAFYLYKLVWPTRLAFDYGRNPAVFLHSHWVYWTWAIPVAIVAGIWLLRRRARWLVPAGLLFVVCLLPVLGLTPFDFQYYSTVTDHYLYLAMIGPALLVAMGLAAYWRTWAVVLSAVLLAVLGVRATAQAGYWRDSVALFKHNLQVNPDSGLSRERLAHYYNQRGNQWAKMVDLADRQARQLRHAGQTQQARQAAEAREQYKKLAMEDWESSVEQYRFALERNPRWPVIRMNYAGVLANLRRFDAAMAQLKRVIDNQASLPPNLRGGYETLWFNAGVRAYEQGKDQEAAEDFQRALRQNPGDAVSSRAYQIVSRKLHQSRAASGPKQDLSIPDD